MLYQQLFVLTSLFALLSGVQLVASHSWLHKIENERTGEIGYPRNYILVDPLADKHGVNLMVTKSSLICNEFQKDAVNLPETPRLKVSPGDRVIGWHRENGHVTDPATAGKSGETYWYITSYPDKGTTLGDVLEWTYDGGAYGALAGTSMFDDGQCAEANPTDISKDRGVGVYGKNKDCRDSGFVVPQDVPVDTTITAYWVWNYSGKYGPNTGHLEYYSHCVDIDIVPRKSAPKIRGVGRYNSPSRARDLDSQE